MDHEQMRRLHGQGAGRIACHIVLRGKREIAADTWLFVFDKPMGFAYRAGQHVRMKLKGEYRFWSFASAPFEDCLAFAIRMRNTRFKRAMKALRVGARVRIEMLAGPPPGAFALGADDVQRAVFLCGGIGVVPAVSMIKQALHNGGRRGLILIHACRRPGDAPFREEMLELAAAHDTFTYVPVMTRPEADDAWTGKAGRIDAALVARHVPDIRQTQVYVAGRHGMVRDMRAMLRGMEVPETAIRAEDFGDFAVHRKSTPWLTLIVAALVLAHGGAFLLGVRFLHPAWGIAAIAAVVSIKLAWLLWRRRGSADG